MRRKTMLAVELLAAFALPATAAAKPPSNADKRGAAKACRAERGTDDATRETFRSKYRNFGTCVSAGARERRAERRDARSNAARDCRAERQAIGVEAFREQCATNRNKRNAFGKCVSAAAADDEEHDEAA